MMKRKGSALLIVLGMISFMVVSAVAFSMFMRQSRLPSSFLRQKIAAAQLVKAGLAEAMLRVDAGIGDNPFPGVGTLGERSTQYRDKEGNSSTTTYGNFWQNRVFMESKVSVDSIGGGDNVDLSFDPISTLNLEALAYLPPSLVDTVRHWAPRSSTSAWASLGYDVGRYAFTAVNVSDFLDVTRFKADAMRDSTAANRLTLGYLFENDQHNGPGPASPAMFDSFMGKSTNDNLRTRLTSLADFNLALAKPGSGAPYPSPFCQYVMQPPGDGSFYGPLKESAKKMRYVADSWFPGALTNSTAVCLSEQNGQPFAGRENGATLNDLEDQPAEGERSGFKVIGDHLDACSFAALYDYLDEDSVPISLAMPTLEQTPMLVGLRVTPMNFEFEFNTSGPRQDPTNIGTPQVPDYLIREAWWVKSVKDTAKLDVACSFAYPFAHSYGKPEGDYTIQVLVRAFLMGSGSSFSETRRDQTGVKPNGPGDWKDESPAVLASSKGYLTFYGEKSLTPTAGAFDPAGDIVLSLTDPNVFQERWVYGIQYRQSQGRTAAQYDDSVDNLGLSPKKVKLPYHNGNFGAGNVLSEVVDGTKLKFNYLVWARIVDGNGKTVDLVPATMKDDDRYDGRNAGSFKLGSCAKISGDREPVIPVEGPQMLDCSLSVFTGPQNGALNAGAVDGLAIYCDDPRFNYAPEDWYKSPSGDISADEWLTAAQNRCDGNNRRGRDIYLFVSDKERLQSMGELQFLPYLGSWVNGAVGAFGDFYTAGKYDGTAFANRGGPGACANANFAWTSHWAFGQYRDHNDLRSDPYNWGILDTRGGPTISPFADFDSVMMGLANTPYDWRVAYGDTGFTLESGRTYCFGPGSSEAPMSLESLQDIADYIREQAKSKSFAPWEDVWRDLNWWGSKDKFLGVDVSADKFHDVDRKFLYSFWKNCFGNDQQLFLIFVRAEPSVMGGSSAGHTPAQLGARAVALVWREPKSTVPVTGGVAAPHRMRILFYHQFD